MNKKAWTSVGRDVFLAAILCTLFCGCNNGGVTPSTTGYSGDWAGTTTQGQPITFTISSGQQVVSLSVGYSFSGCTGQNVYSGLSLAITNPQPSGPPPFDNPGFGYATSSGGANGTLVTGAFTSASSATGIVQFIEYSNCGGATSLGNWNATKR